jgi:hypothetical protein
MMMLRRGRATLPGAARGFRIARLRKSGQRLPRDFSGKNR